MEEEDYYVIHDSEDEAEVVKGSLIPGGGMDSEDFGMPKSLQGFRRWVS